jgi:hypothetical protein
MTVRPGIGRSGVYEETSKFTLKNSTPAEMARTMTPVATAVLTILLEVYEYGSIVVCALAEAIVADEEAILAQAMPERQ